MTDEMLAKTIAAFEMRIIEMESILTQCRVHVAELHEEQGIRKRERQRQKEP
jgi:hypothetical protein